MDKKVKKVKCWEVFKCKEKECPAYKSKNLRCWLFSGTHCWNEIQGQFLEKMEMCLGCKVFKANMDVAAMRSTIGIIDKQFKEFRQIVNDRDREMENIGLELAVCLSEVFEALKKISSGDPLVRIDESSEVELITRLKHIVNMTAEEIGEIVDQSHEFAICLAEHFDVLYRVSKGDLNARVYGISQLELLESLKKITNNMIDSISREITERKRAEKAIREKEERESLILSSLPMAFYTAQADLGWIWVSEQIDQITGFSANKYLEDPHFWASRLHPDDREHVLKELETIHDKGTIATEYRWLCANGLYTWFRDQAVLVRDDQGIPKEIIGTKRDITWRKQSEEALREAQEGLIIAEKHIGIGRLAGGVAHEIKNQLTPILTEVQRIIGQIENGEELPTQYVLERARTIEEASRTANKITMALLDYARASRPEFGRYNLRASIEGVMALYQSDFTRANIRVTLEGLEAEEIFADKRQIEQVLINIVNNAYEAIIEKGEGGTIAISANREDPYMVITIQDTGIGILKEDQVKVFDPFFTTKAPRGIGLGLSVSYGIVERHGGRIDFDSQPGKGSIFKVYLPLKDEKDVIPI